MVKRTIKEDGSYESRFYYLDDKDRLRSRVIIKQTYHGRIGFQEIVHRFDEGYTRPWCLSGNRRTKMPPIVHRTEDEVTCKLCLSDSRLTF